ncbi:MAG TPA: serine/threonine-protein kinase, partial [Ktedonobacteraceae bacterium]
MSDYVGQQLGGYTLTKKLGDGGFADVYLGEHIYLDNKKAAIKVLKGTFADQDIKKFHEEAQIIHRLQHPHIVRVIDFNVTSLNGQQGPFLVMEHAPHGSLREQHQRGTKLPLATIISYVKPIATALQYAHDQKVIHRDIKPANLLLGENKELLLSDFGNAVMAHSTQSMPAQDNTGTWAYMAPEQFIGKPRLASDQYALGIVIYQWLSGELPFAGPNFELFAYQHAKIAPPPLDKKVLPAVEAVVLQALAKDPHQRFNSVKAFAIALEQASELALSVPLILSARPGYPATIPAREATPQATKAPPYVAVVKKYQVGIPFDSYLKNSLILQQILPYWYSELQTKQNTKSPSQSLFFEVNAVYQLLQELLTPHTGKLSRNLILYLVDDYLIQNEIQAVIQEGKVTDQIFNPERYIASYLTGLQAYVGPWVYQQLYHNPNYTPDEVK